MGFDIGGVIGAIMSAQAANNAAALDWANLQFQKENARKQYGLATASRTDAYGNEQSFDDLLKKWKVSLTPTQSGIVKAGEREQKLSLTEDAGRNRDLRRRQDVRSKNAGEDYNRAVIGNRFDQPKSEDAIAGDLARLIGSSRQQALGAASDSLGRQAIRTGNSGALPQIIKQANDTLGNSFTDNILKARSGAATESQGRNAAHDAKYLPEIQQWGSIMDDVGQAPQRFSDTPAAMSGQQNQMLQAIMAALGNESSQVGGAYGQLANRIASSAPNLAGLLKFDGSGFGGGGGSDTASDGFSARSTPAAGTTAPFAGFSPIDFGGGHGSDFLASRVRLGNGGW